MSSLLDLRLGTLGVGLCAHPVCFLWASVGIRTTKSKGGSWVLARKRRQKVAPGEARGSATTKNKSPRSGRQIGYEGTTLV